MPLGPGLEPSRRSLGVLLTSVSRKQLWRGSPSHSLSQWRVPCSLFNGSPEKQGALPPGIPPSGRQSWTRTQVHLDL